jgi:hypothetical protein
MRSVQSRRYYEETRRSLTFSLHVPYNTFNHSRCLSSRTLPAIPFPHLLLNIVFSCTFGLSILHGYGTYFGKCHLGKTMKRRMKKGEFKRKAKKEERESKNGSKKIKKNV